MLWNAEQNRGIPVAITMRCVLGTAACADCSSIEQCGGCSALMCLSCSVNNVPIIAGWLLYVEMSSTRAVAGFADDATVIQDREREGERNLARSRRWFEGVPVIVGGVRAKKHH